MKYRELQQMVNYVYSNTGLFYDQLLDMDVSAIERYYKDLHIKKNGKYISIIEEEDE